MSTKDKHMWKAERNFSFYKELSDNEFSCAYNEWKITVIFYSALHHLKTCFLSNKDRIPKCPNSHEEIFKLINSFSLFKPIRSPYGTLFDLSHEARYKCTSMSGNDLNKAIEYYNEFIENLRKIA